METPSRSEYHGTDSQVNGSPFFRLFAFSLQEKEETKGISSSTLLMISHRDERTWSRAPN